MLLLSHHFHHTFTTPQLKYSPLPILSLIFNLKRTCVRDFDFKVHRDWPRFRISKTRCFFPPVHGKLAGFLVFQRCRVRLGNIYLRIRPSTPHNAGPTGPNLTPGDLTSKIHSEVIEKLSIICLIINLNIFEQRIESN